MNKKHFYLAAALCLCSSSINAETVVDFTTNHLSNQILRQNRSNIKTLSQNTSASLIPVIISVENSSAADAVAELGIEPVAVEGNFIFANVTPGQVNALAATPGIKRISGQKRRHKVMHNGRAAAGVDKVHEGEGVNPLTGKGVIVGIVDGGFDPNHVAFRSRDLSKNRVLQLSHYKSDDDGNLISVDTYTTDKLNRFSTDDASDYHATHVTGIAAGAYNEADRGRRFHGVAPDADIFMGALDSYSDAEIIRACQDIRDIASSKGQPAVINMSLGVNVGPHDGTDPFSKALESIAAEIPVCIAAGNEADLDIVINKTLTESDKTVRTSFSPNSDLKDIDINYQVASEIQIWSDDATPFDVNVLIVSKSNGSVIKSYPVKTAFTEEVPDSRYYDTYSSFTQSEKGLSEDNNRYYADIYMEWLASSRTWSTYPAIEVIGKPGQTIRIYNDGYYTEFSTKRFSGYDSPTPDGTINDMACGKNIISVGAYNASISGFPLSYFSSYGTLADGRVLPLVCAPGQNVISAMSTPYYNANYEKPEASFTYNGKKYHYGSMSGTSMATPFVTGAVALWLEANPEMTPADIRNLIENTSVATDNANQGWGNGKIDVFAGAKLALNSGVEEIIADSDKNVLINRTGAASFEIFTPGTENPAVTVFSISGNAVVSATGSGNSATIDMSSCPAGAYIISVEGTFGRHATKIIR